MKWTLPRVRVVTEETYPNPAIGAKNPHHVIMQIFSNGRKKNLL